MWSSPPEETFRPTLALRLALGLLLGLPAAGAFALGAVAGGEGQVAFLAVGVAIVALGVALLWWIGKRRLELHPEGVRLSTAFGARELAWEEIAEYRYRAIPIRAGAHFGLIGAVVEAAVASNQTMVQHWLLLRGKAGAPIRVTATFKRAPEAIAKILERVHERILPELVRRFAAGERLPFGPLSLGKDGLAYKKKPPVPLSSLSRIEIAGPRLRALVPGKLLAAVACATAEVPNVMALLQLAGGEGVLAVHSLPVHVTMR